MSKNKTSNPFGVFGDAVQPRAIKHKGMKCKVVATIAIAPQDTEEWTQRVICVHNTMEAIADHINKDKNLKFIKRRFFLSALENHIAKFLADNPDVIVK